MTTAKKIRESRIANAKKFGRIDDSGRVFLSLGKKATDGEKMVGEYLEVDKDVNMTLYVNRFVDLEEKIDLFEQRLASDLNITSPVIDASLLSFNAFLKIKNGIGDYSELEKRIVEVAKKASERKELNAQKRKELVETSLKELNQIVTDVEKILAPGTDKIIFKDAKVKIENALEQWTTIRKSVKLPEKVCDELWVRFRTVRDTVNRESRAFNEKFKKTAQEVKSRKNLIIAEAEKIKDSENFADTKREFSRLMEKWKQIGKEIGSGKKSDDEALWKKFKEIQDYFYARIPKTERPAQREEGVRWDNDLKPLSNSVAQTAGDKLAELKAQLEGK